MLVTICWRCFANKYLKVHQLKSAHLLKEIRRTLKISAFTSSRKIDGITCDESLIDWDQNNYGNDIEGRFIDWTKLKVKAGNGGDGMVHMKRGKRLLGPDGGDGGKGGDVVIMADQSQKHLKGVKMHYKAQDGGKGRRDFCRGKNGNSVIIKVPIGTVVMKKESREVLADLASQGSTFIVSSGGTGGLGNANFKSSTNQRPAESTPGVPGEEANIELEMKSIADVGLVGFPNAGKSTLLRALSRAKPAVAAYPFTTLKPNIGVIQYKDLIQIAVADIPGLVEDAHANKGLGHSFLRHIERCSSLLFVIDLSDDAYLENYYILKKEVKLFNEELLTLPTAVVANKIDIAEKHVERLNNIKENVNLPVIGISGRHLLNIEELKILIRKLVASVKEL